VHAHGVQQYDKRCSSAMLMPPLSCCQTDRRDARRARAANFSSAAGLVIEIAKIRGKNKEGLGAGSEAAATAVILSESANCLELSGASRSPVLHLGLDLLLDREGELMSADLWRAPLPPDPIYS